MARPIRVEYPYAIYHIISRGIRRDNIYREDDDKNKFLEKLIETKEKYKKQKGSGLHIYTKFLILLQEMLIFNYYGTTYKS